MKMTHISLSITTFKYAAPYIFYYENLNGKIRTSTKLSYADACRKMWELKKLGGKKTLEVHPFSPTIATREVKLWDFD